MIDKSFKLSKVIDNASAIILLEEIGNYFGLNAYGLHGDYYLPQIRSNKIIKPKDITQNYFCIYFRDHNFYYEYKLDKFRTNGCIIWDEQTVGYLYELIETFTLKLKEFNLDEKLDNIKTDFV